MMAYNGYLIKINTIELPNRYIDRSSWMITPIARRVVESFYDVDGRYHEYLSDHQQTKIQFKIREHSEAEHSIIAAFLQERYRVRVTYYNDLTEEYGFGNFRISDPVFTHKKTFDDTVWYEETQITMTEY